MNKVIFFLIQVSLSCCLQTAFAQSDFTGLRTDFDIDLDTKVYYHPKQPDWIKGEHLFTYYVNTPQGKTYYVADVNTGKKERAFETNKLINSLSGASNAEINTGNFDFSKLKFINRNRISYKTRQQIWEVDLKDYSVRITAQDRPVYDRFSSYDRYRFDREVISPDKKKIAYIRNYNVYVRSATDSAAVTQLSFDGSVGEFYPGSSLIWSPDSQKLFAQKVRPGADREVHYIESSPSDQLQPKYHSLSYLKPGDALPQVSPVIFLDNGTLLKAGGVDISNQYSLSNFKWREDSRSVTFEYNQRGHQKYQVLEMSSADGKMKILVNETVDTFFPYTDLNLYGKKYRYDVNDGEEIIWASERDGWNHLYLFDGKTGQIKNQITKGEWVVRSVIHVDEKNRSILFEAGGYHPGQDPYFRQVFRINFDGTQLKPLTPENANHIVSFSDDYAYFADTYSRIDKSPKTVLRNAADGKVIQTLEEANIEELLKLGWAYPEVFTAKGRDGKTDIWGIIIRPAHFDSQKKYPVIEYIYAGPHDSFVPKSFDPNPRDNALKLAQLGFIVVQIDGMGTSNRSKKFHDVAFKNLKDAGFPDRIAWIKSAAQKYPYMDLTRVGIYGRSAGGQSSTAALLFHPDFYKVAVSLAGSHDNRMDKIWWNEQWMGYPIGPQYKENSNTENAFRLQGDLMLQVGELDTNVDPSTTFQLVDALIKNNKTFEFVFLPGEDHQQKGDFAELKRREFFVRKLLKQK